jgi:hypothetical protein
VFQVNDAFKFSKETQLLPIIATAVKDQLIERTASSPSSPLNHHPILLELIAQQLCCQGTTARNTSNTNSTVGAHD